MNTFIGFFFGTLVVAGVFSMVKIHLAEDFAKSEAERKRQARIEALRAKCFRPDGD